MAKSAKRPRSLATFKHTVRIEVRQAEFELMASLDQLDVAKLGRAARAEIEIGYFKTGCCRQFVRATVRKGMVTALDVEPCSDDKLEPASKDLTRLFRLARKRIAPKDGPPFGRPMPVADFMQNAKKITVRTITCSEICIFGFCFVCCTTPTNKVVCGKRVIVVTP